MSKITSFLELLKGEENDYFDYNLYLNNNWEKIDSALNILYNRDNSIYADEAGAVGNALYKRVSVSAGNQIITWWSDSLFRSQAKDNYTSILNAINNANTANKSFILPKGRYYISKELVLSQLNIDFVFEKGTVLIGNVTIKNVNNIAFKNLTIEGNLTLESVKSCKFLNTSVTGKTKFGVSTRGNESTLNSFINCSFTNTLDKSFEFFCNEDSTTNNTSLTMIVSKNTFLNCSFNGLTYGIYADILDSVVNSEISHNLFINSKSESINGTSIYLGKNTKAFNFVEQSAKGINSINLENSNGNHIFSGGMLDGQIYGFDKFLIYKPAISDDVSFEKLGNNINNMRKMKVFDNEVPKWINYNVLVSNDHSTLGFTGDGCLKISNSASSSFPTLERVFTASDHLNQPVNVIARVKATLSNNGNSDAALILTNGDSNDTTTIPIETDGSWRIITAKLESTTDKEVTVKLCPNNSYANSANNLFVDWIVIALGDFAQYNSIPGEEHHYENLDHYGDFNIHGNSSVTGNMDIAGNFSVNGEVNGDVNIKDGNLSLLKETAINQSAEVSFDLGASNSSSVNDLSTFKYRFKVEGNQENQIVKVYAVNRKVNIGGDTEILEEILELSNETITYKGNEIHHDSNSSGLGSVRPENPKPGREFFDTILQKPIWFTGLMWVDANGNEV